MRHLIDFGDLPREEWDSLYARAKMCIRDSDRRMAQRRYFPGW